MHAATVDPDHGLGQKGSGEAHLGRHLAANQLVKLDLVRRCHHIAIAVVDFKLRRRHLRVVLLVLESHRALHFGAGIDERAQRIAGQRVIVAAGVDVLETLRLVIVALRIGALEKKSLNFVGRIQRVALLLVESLA